MSRRSTIELLSMHGIRILGHATSDEVGRLYGIAAARVHEHLLDAEAFGWVRKSSFGGDVRWSMTEAGRRTDGQLLNQELIEYDAHDVVLDAHRRFVPLNAQLGRVMTQWQLRPTREDPLAFNDHQDHRYDDRVLARLVSLAEDLREVTAALSESLGRFGVHQPRIDHALAQVQELRNEWVDSPEVASMNLVWIQLHEDLLATLGIGRGGEGG